MTEILAGTAIMTVAGAWRWWTADKQTIARRLALRLMAYAEGLDARDAAVKAAMQKEVRLV